MLDHAGASPRPRAFQMRMGTALKSPRAFIMGSAYGQARTE